MIANNLFLTTLTTPLLDTLMAHVYEKRKDPDGFLYITYTDETTLGAMPEQMELWTKGW